MSLNESIINIRVKLQQSKLKKSGVNKFAGFDYFELADFLPRLNELMAEEKVNDIFNIKGDVVELELVKGEERNTYTMPFVMFETPLNKQGQKSMQDIQYLGALNTYYKRYLYLNAFGITDGEIIDSMNNQDVAKPAEEPITAGQLTTLNKILSPENRQVVLTQFNIADINQLTKKQAMNIIAQLKKKQEENALPIKQPADGREFY